MRICEHKVFLIFVIFLLYCDVINARRNDRSRLTKRNMRAMCRKPNSVEHAELTEKYQKKDKFKDGDKIKYKCEIGYTIAGKSKKRVCKNGKWSNVQFACNAKCPKPNPVERAELTEKYQMKDKFKDGDKIKYKCKSGYTIEGRSKKRVCKNGKWSEVQFTCNDLHGQKGDSSSSPSKKIWNQDDFEDLSIDQMLSTSFVSQEYAVESGYTVAELDMVVERDHYNRKSRGPLRTIAVKDKTKRWEQSIPFKIADGMDYEQKDSIQTAMQEWSRYSCIDFFPASDYQYNMIVFKLDNECSSRVGMQQGLQEISLGKKCFKKEIIIHEVGHALGLYHEHNRWDRDKYIEIHYENVIEGQTHSFRKHEPDSYIDFKRPYDYMSIMHYGQYFFSKNESEKLITIETKNHTFQNKIGMVKHPSFFDYKTVTDMYGCADDCASVRCPNDGFFGKNCRCFCQGKSDGELVRPCFRNDECPKPSINKHLFDVMNKENKTTVNMNRASFPDETVLNLFSTNWDCYQISSQLRCGKGKWTGRITECPIKLDLNVTDGTEGIMEVVLNNITRGYVCDDDWDDNDATVACKMLGFIQGLALSGTSTQINESLPILLDNVQCSGEELSLTDCKHNEWGIHNCNYSEVASVKCFHETFTNNVDLWRKLDCRKTQSQRKKRSLRITGGKVAVKGMHPWQVEIQRKIEEWEHFCGGTIIDNEWILSAAHCFDYSEMRLANGAIVKLKYEDIRVLVGDHDLKKPDEYERTFDIEYIVKHWNYSGIDGKYAVNDIALIKIKSVNGFTFNEYIQPACLPTEDDLPPSETKCIVSGWGRKIESGDISNELRTAEVEIISEEVCKEFYNRYPIDIKKMFCAGKGGKDTCMGDSGGPLICEVDGNNTIIGITSWGEGCGRAESPGVYTNVPMFNRWIKEQISNHNPPGCTLSDDQRYRYSDMKGIEIKPGENIAVGMKLNVHCNFIDIYACKDYEYYIYYTNNEGSEDNIIICNDNNEFSQLSLECPEGEQNDECMKVDNGEVRKSNDYYVVSCNKGFSLDTIVPEESYTCDNGRLTSIIGDQPKCIPVICDDECKANGGTCIGPRKCECPKGKFGNNCKHSGCKLPALRNIAIIQSPRAMFTPGETIRDIQCDTGYVLSSNNGMTCQNDG